jgi:Flp pilus assembly protein TadG
MRAFLLRRDDGSSTLELGLIVPILMLLLVTVMPLVKAGGEYMVVSRASAHGIRYATRVDANARMSSGGYLTRRPTTDEVSTFVREAADPLVLTDVSVSPEPASSLPGDLITVRSTYTVSFGPIAGLANDVSELFFGRGPLLPDSKTITVTARGREE